MAEEDLGRAVYEAVRANIRSVRESGQAITPSDFWEGVKDKVAHEYPSEFERAKTWVINYNNGKFDDNEFDRYLDTLRDDYENKLAHQKLHELDKG